MVLKTATRRRPGIPAARSGFRRTQPLNAVAIASANQGRMRQSSAPKFGKQAMKSHQGPCR